MFKEWKVDYYDLGNWIKESGIIYEGKGREILDYLFRFVKVIICIDFFYLFFS